MLRNLARKAVSATSNPWRSSKSIQLLQKRDFCLGVLPDGVGRNSEAFAQNSKAMEGLISQLQSHINKVHAHIVICGFYMCLLNVLGFEMGLFYFSRFLLEEDKKL